MGNKLSAEEQQQQQALLFEACKTGNVNSIRYLVRKKRVDPNQKDKMVSEYGWHGVG